MRSRLLQNLTRWIDTHQVAIAAVAVILGGVALLAYAIFVVLEIGAFS